ncbi:MAG TPA: methyltransferase domain-containing protein [Gemmatimonadaceae bacterium]|nr:methyltransferase domain-containing protein [Gemmatimonadaceae bacterium]
MSLITSLLQRVLGRRTAQGRWDERWADPAFYAEFRLDELAHYGVVAAYAHVLRPGGALLDAGCGDGVLRTHLHPDAFSTYLGVDFPEAIARARTREDARTSFIASDMREFVPQAKLDTIVFCESLYYVDDPVAEMNRYAKFLNPGGIFILSMHRKPRSETIWTTIRGSFPVIDRVVLANHAGVEWNVGAFKPD